MITSLNNVTSSDATTPVFRTAIMIVEEPQRSDDGMSMVRARFNLLFVFFSSFPLLTLAGYETTRLLLGPQPSIELPPSKSKGA